MIWWRIELDKDGSIKSCEQVEANQKNLRLVRYVEAATKADACDAAKRWWGHKKEVQRAADRRRTQQRLSEKKCVLCRVPSERRHCSGCREKANVWRREYRAGRTQKKTPGPETVLYARHHGPWYTILRRFDAVGPAEFRKWLVAKLNAKGAQVT